MPIKLVEVLVMANTNGKSSSNGVQTHREKEKITASQGLDPRS